MSENSGWRVYLVRCRDATLYCGSTTDIARRVGEHNSGNGAKYTKSRRPVELVWSTPAKSRSDAFKKESAIKKLSRKQKNLLVESRGSLKSAFVAKSSEKSSGEAARQNSRKRSSNYSEFDSSTKHGAFYSRL